MKRTLLAALTLAVLTATAFAAPPALTPAVLGDPKADAASLLTTDKDTLTLKAAGRESYGGRDDGTFAGMKTDALHFTFTARIAKGAEGKNPKFGITVRTGLAGSEKAVQLRYDGWEGNRAIQWFMRYHVAPDSHDGSGRAFIDGVARDFPDKEGTHLKLVRNYPYVDAYVSTDGTSWTQIPYRPVLLDRTVHVGLQATAGGDGKTPITVAFDNVSFTEHPAPKDGDTPETWQEYHPKVQTHRIYIAKVADGSKDGDFTAVMVMPKDMQFKDIRALLFTTGSKEVLMADGKSLPFENGPGRVRRPAGMAEWEGFYETDKVHPHHQMLAHHGVVRFGGYWHPKGYKAAIARMAEVTGMKDLPNVPLLPTGASFAGGNAAAAAALYPEQTVAAAPVIIGMAGSDTTNPAVLATPHLHIYGSRDGVHLKTAVEATPKLRTKNALWANAPMWMVYHRQHKADALLYPYFFELLDLRLPANADHAKPPALKPLDLNAGYWGLIDTWNTNFPQVAPVKGFKENTQNLVWLPNEKLARLWQAFTSNNPRTVIHFPAFEGASTYGGNQPYGWHNSFLAADEPFNIVASGPLNPDGSTKDLKVTFYAGLTPLKTTPKSPDNPYRVTAEALPAGLHSIYAITELEGKQEISRPVTIMFQKRKE